MALPPRKRARTRQGFTVFELLISMVVLLVAAGGAMGALSSTVVLSESTWETGVAYAAAQRALERLQGEGLSQVLARYNASTADDPPNAPGPDFDVLGLAPRTDDPDGRVGRVVFPSVPGAPTALREDALDPDFGLPRDLNGDGLVDGLDHAGDYDLLPVLIRIEWRSQSGNRSVEVQTLLTAR